MHRFDRDDTSGETDRGLLAIRSFQGLRVDGVGAEDLSG